MKQKAVDLWTVLCGQLGSLGPGARSVSLHSFLTWDVVRVGVANDEQLRDVADDLGLVQARTERRGRIWWREVTSRADGLIVIAAGPYRPGEPPDGALKP